MQQRLPDTSKVTLRQGLKRYHSGHIVALSGVMAALLIAACSHGTPKPFVIQGHLLGSNPDKTEYTVLGEDGELWIILKNDIERREEWKSPHLEVPGDPVQLKLKPGAEIKNVMFVPFLASLTCACPIDCGFGYCCAQTVLGQGPFKPRCGVGVCKVTRELCR